MRSTIIGILPLVTDGYPTRKENGVSSRPVLMKEGGFPRCKFFMSPKRRTMLGVALLSFSAILLCSLSSFVSFMVSQSLSSSNSKNSASALFGLHAQSLTPTASTSASSNPTISTASNLLTTAPATGARLVMLGVNQDTLTSLLASQLGVQQSTLTNLKIALMPNNEVTMTMNLNISASGIHRVMPIELDCIIGLDQQMDIQMRVLSFKRDGLDAGSAAATRMQTTLNQLLLSLLMPSLHSQLKGMKIVSLHTSQPLCCEVKNEMLVLVIQMN